MKKIFIPVITLLTISIASPSYSRWGGNFSQSNHLDNDSLFSADSDGYWLNKFRGYKKFPINFYSQRLLNKNSGEKTEEVEAHVYQRNVAVTARVGQRMYDSTTYKITTKTGSEQYKAVKSGSLYTAQTEVKIKEGQLFTPLGEIKVNGQYYVLFEVPDSDYIIAADYKGKFLDAIGLIEGGNLYVNKDITVINPRDLGVEPYQETTEDTGDAELNFEIKYGGIQGEEMSFIVSNGQESDYDQRQFVPLNEKIVQINNVGFEIIHASPDYIEYKILEN